MAMQKRAKCAECAGKRCVQGKDCFAGAADVRGTLTDSEIQMLRCASSVEAEFYMQATRLEELIEFSSRMGYKRLGVAFCIGLAAEAELLCKVLSARFEVFSACCKACGLDKSELGLKYVRDEEFEAMCNPVGQARLLAREKTELNLILGLCVGHDMLFTAHSAAPVSTFAVKDRVLGHNPLAALYSSYYRKRRFNLDE